MFSLYPWKPFLSLSNTSKVWVSFNPQQPPLPCLLFLHSTPSLFHPIFCHLFAPRFFHSFHSWSSIPQPHPLVYLSKTPLFLSHTNMTTSHISDPPIPHSFFVSSPSLPPYTPAQFHPFWLPLSTFLSFILSLHSSMHAFNPLSKFTHFGPLFFHSSISLLHHSCTLSF